MNTQFSRISHHAISTPGATFSVPPGEDFTIINGSQSWNLDGTELADREFGINTYDNKLYLRNGATISEIGLDYTLPTYLPQYVTFTTTTNATTTGVTVSVATASSALVSFKVNGYDPVSHKYLVTSQEAHIKVSATNSIGFGSNTFFLTNDFSSGGAVSTATGSNYLNINVTGETSKNILWKIIYEVL